MRKLILTLGMALAIMPAFGRETKKHYNKSVFYELQGTKTINSPAAEKTAAMVKELFPGWSAYTDKHSGALTDAYGDAWAVNGNTITEKAGYVMGNMLSQLGVKATEWQKMKAHEGKKADHVNYVRVIDGHTVMFSKMSFRFTKDGQLTRIQMRAYGSPAAKTPTLSRNAVVAGNYETADIPEITITSKEVKNWVWFPVPVENGYELHPAWEVIINAKAEESVPLKLRCYVDGKDGKLLYRTNDVKEAFDVTVKGSVITTTIFNPPTDEPLENLIVYGPSAQYTTNNLGFVSDPFQPLPAMTTFRLEGQWSVVWDDINSQVPSYNQNIVSLGSTYTFPTPARFTSAYYHVNKIHEVMKSYFPSFNTLDFQLPTNVDLTSGTCNAYYDGASINFYVAGGGCNCLAETPDVIYHEYGHGINHHYYDFMGMGFMQNGALNEAYADVWGISIPGIPVIGNGALTNIPGGGYFRRYDMAPHILSRDLIEEVHGDGEIIAGAWWDVGQNMGSVADMTALFTLTYDDTPDGPDGTEGDVYHQVLISALLNDDNDANLSNGTPHFSEIVRGFARHGIYVTGETETNHTDIPHQPWDKEISISANILAQDPTLIQKANLYYKNRSSNNWTAVPMTISGSNFSAKIPPHMPGNIIDYYFQLYTLQGEVTGTFPLMYDSTKANAHNVTIPYQFAVHVAAQDSNKFEGAVTGWTIGNAPGDDASAGEWIQAIPVASYAGTSISPLYISQMGNDHTTGSGKCLVTGNASSSSDPVGDRDVDNGTTTVITPSFNLSGYAEPIIEYYRWYADSKGGNAHNDLWVVKVGSSTTGNWKVVDSTHASDYNWRRRIFAVKDYTTTLNDVQVKFVACDSTVASLRNDGQSVVEAGVDDFFIYDKAPVGITDPETMKAIIAPNPADEMVRISIAGKYSGNALLYDATGRVVYTMAVEGNNKQYTVSTKALPAGQYMLVLQSGSTIQSQKLIIRHN